MALPLTRREVDAFEYLRSREPVPPSLGELANHLEVSQTRACELLRNLKEKGWITREPGRHRAMATVAMSLR